ncbi:ORMDL family protein [Striga asiatica]|uniref:ORMDL family protein n=1 Tax=Striga asiatica TaxID=4170 RepID=A0A5A7P4A6_STRAF|nr:ORMDL family protein [Striga asiatica]
MAEKYNLSNSSPQSDCSLSLPTSLRTVNKLASSFQPDLPLSPAVKFQLPPPPTSTPCIVNLFDSSLQFHLSAVKFPLSSVVNFQPLPPRLRAPCTRSVPALASVGREVLAPNSVRREVLAPVSFRREFLVPASVEHILPPPPALPTHQTSFVDNGKQLTRNRKFLTVAPVVLDHWQLIVINPKNSAVLILY